MSQPSQLGLLPRCGMAPTNCTHETCNNGAASLVTILEPGTYRVAVGVFERTDNLPLSLVVQHRPIAATTFGVIMPAAAMQTSSFAGAVDEATCGESRPAQFVAWTSCPEEPARTLTASACGDGTFAPSLELWNGDGLPSVGAACGSWCMPELRTTIAAGVGLHVLFVSAPSSMPGASYMLRTTYR